jgi:hypothetical protein
MQLFGHENNALGHSCASYRFALSNHAGRVAGECGNSAGVILKHHREPNNNAGAFGRTQSQAAALRMAGRRQIHFGEDSPRPGSLGEPNTNSERHLRDTTPDLRAFVARGIPSGVVMTDEMEIFFAGSVLHAPDERN